MAEIQDNMFYDGGDPEGDTYMECDVSSIFRDVDNGVFYIKKTGTGTNTGFLGIYFNAGVPAFAARGGSLCLDTTNHAWYQKTVDGGTTGWTAM